MKMEVLLLKRNRKVFKVVVFNTTMFKINKGERQTMNIRKAQPSSHFIIKNDR